MTSMVHALLAAKALEIAAGFGRGEISPIDEGDRTYPKMVSVYDVEAALDVVNRQIRLKCTEECLRFRFGVAGGLRYERHENGYKDRAAHAEFVTGRTYVGFGFKGQEWLENTLRLGAFVYAGAQHTNGQQASYPVGQWGIGWWVGIRSAVQVSTFWLFGELSADIALQAESPAGFKHTVHAAVGVRFDL
jgi:hypothetical protein